MAIKSKRSEMGVSQEELADRAGLHRTYVSDIERGTRNPSLESIEKLAQALEISLPALFGRAAASGAENRLVEILLVEDELRDAELTVHAFKTARITNPVHIVRDGAAALDFVFATGAYAHRRGSAGPGVILLDLNLPKVHGIEVLRRLKAQRATRNIPVVILTVSDQDRDIAACRRLGAESYIIKPVRFRNFSEAMPRLRFDWALLKSSDAPVFEETS
jgi:two-component system response regulator